MSIYVITHKKFAEKKQDFYKVLLVGAHKGHIFGECFDDEGDNISTKNSSFCELTGAYWIWKNVNDDIIGIVHYRRYFSNQFGSNHILSEVDIRKKLKRHDIILPFKRKLDCSVEEQYCRNSGKKEDLITLRNIIMETCPDYVKSFDKVMQGNETYFFNMLICKKELFNAYNEWLFQILFQVEERVDTSSYNDYQKRIFGFMSERLLYVWVLHNNLNIYETGVVNTEEAWGIGKNFLIGMKRWLLFRIRP